MGCGSSSLKGDDVPNLNSTPSNTSATPEPIKKIKTNFSTVDYDQDARSRRMTEYAPHEKAKAARESHDLGAGDTSGRMGSDPTRAADGEADTALKPYRTVDGADWDKDDVANVPSASAHHANGTSDTADPTSGVSKDAFASANEPANPLNQKPHRKGSKHSGGADDGSLAAGEVSDRKKSWLGQKYASVQNAKRGTGTSGISDEELKKYTGKDRGELKEWAKTADGVAGNQGGGRVNTDTRLAASAPWTA